MKSMMFRCRYCFTNTECCENDPHELVCLWNPENKRCYTCIFYIRGSSGHTEADPECSFLAENGKEFDLYERLKDECPNWFRNPRRW